MQLQGSHRKHHSPYKTGELSHQFTLTIVTDIRVESTYLRLAINKWKYILSLLCNYSQWRADCNWQRSHSNRLPAANVGPGEDQRLVSLCHCQRDHWVSSWTQEICWACQVGEKKLRLKTQKIAFQGPLPSSIPPRWLKSRMSAACLWRKLTVPVEMGWSRCFRAMQYTVLSIQHLAPPKTQWCLETMATLKWVWMNFGVKYHILFCSAKSALQHVWRAAQNCTDGRIGAGHAAVAQKKGFFANLPIWMKSISVYQLDLEILFKTFFWPGLYSTLGTLSYIQTCFSYKQVSINAIPTGVNEYFLTQSSLG